MNKKILPLTKKINLCFIDSVSLTVKSEKLTVFESFTQVFYIFSSKQKPISGRVDRASATKTVDSDSIPGRVKPKTKEKNNIHSFLA